MHATGSREALVRKGAEIGELRLHASKRRLVHASRPSELGHGGDLFSSVASATRYDHKYARAHGETSEFIHDCLPRRRAVRPRYLDSLEPANQSESARRALGLWVTGKFTEFAMKHSALAL